MAFEASGPMNTSRVPVCVYPSAGARVGGMSVMSVMGKMSARWVGERVYGCTGAWVHG